MYRFYQGRPFKDGKENILVPADTFTKFSQAFIIPNQKALTKAKILVDGGFMCMVSHTNP